MKSAAPLFRFKQGDHICVFYEDENALLDFLIPYFEEGLRNGERCFCAQTPNMVERIRKRLKKNGAVDLSAWNSIVRRSLFFYRRICTCCTDGAAQELSR